MLTDHLNAVTVCVFFFFDVCTRSRYHVWRTGVHANNAGCICCLIKLTGKKLTAFHDRVYSVQIGKWMASRIYAYACVEVRTSQIVRVLAVNLQCVQLFLRSYSYYSRYQCPLAS